jgi:hypothetical protein
VSASTSASIPRPFRCGIMLSDGASPERPFHSILSIAGARKAGCPAPTNTEAELGLCVRSS